LKFQLNVELDSAPPLIGNISTVDALNAQDILNLMRKLPAMLLAIFNLYEVDGYNHDEIANMLNIPVSSSRVYLSRAKEKMRKIISNETRDHGRSI
jgi:DNA-directed RNA polymerase specialized sigma24 family protein